MRFAPVVLIILIVPAGRGVSPGWKEILFNRAAADQVGDHLVDLATQVVDHLTVGVEGGEGLLAPLARESVLAAAAQGAASALTGPIARGDVATLEGHLRALGESKQALALRESHAAVSRLAIELLRVSGRGDPDTLDRLESLLSAAVREARSDVR